MAASSSYLERTFFFLATLALVTACLYWAQEILIPFAVAFLLTFVLTPAVLALQRWGLKRSQASLLVVFLALVILGTLVTAVTFQVQELIGSLPRHREVITEKITSLLPDGRGLLGDLTRTIQEIKKDVQKESGQTPTAQPVVVEMQNPWLLSWFSGLVGPVSKGLVEAALIIVLVIFMLIFREDLRNRVLRLIGNGRVTHTTRAFDDATQRISRFLMMQSVVNGGFGILLGTGLFIMGVPYALLWGFLAALLRFIPFVGTWVACLLPLAFSLIAFPGWLEPLLTLALFLVLEVVAANFVEPFLLGKSTGVAPIALLSAAAFWAWLWGPIGLILSTPLTTCLVVLGKYVPHLEFLGILLGESQMLEPAVAFYQRLLARDQDEATDLVEDYLRKHRVEELFDDFLLPTLAAIRADRDRSELTAADQERLVQVFQRILDDLPDKPEDSETAEADSDHQRINVFACPARDEIDCLGLQMLTILLDRSKFKIELFTPDALAVEIGTRIQEAEPGLVCIGCLAPGGVAQTRYLCKRLRGRLPDARILVGCWQLGDNRKEVAARLKGAGANHVAGTLRDTVAHLQVLAPCAAAEANNGTLEAVGCPVI